MRFLQGFLLGMFGLPLLFVAGVILCNLLGHT